MSTKIYNGYKIPDYNTRELVVYLRDIRKIMEPVFKKLYASRCAFLIAEEIDSNIVHKREKKEHSPIYRAVKKVQDAIQEKTRREPTLDLGFSIVLIPSSTWMVRGEPRSILALLYTEQNELKQVWEQTPGVQEYCYWNNSDKPDHIDEMAWDIRKENWELALGELGIPSVVGFSYDFVGDLWQLWPQTTDILGNMPSYDFRLNQAAEDLLFKDFKGQIEGETLEYTIHEAMDRYYDFCKWVKTDEGRAAIGKKKEELKAVLKPEFTNEDLWGNYASNGTG